MWCIHNYPTYGLALGQVTKGYKGCPQCGPNISIRQLVALEKNVYFKHYKYLNIHHSFQSLKRLFYRKEEMWPPPSVMKGEDMMQFAKDKEQWLNASPSNKPSGANDLVHKIGVKRLSLLYKLPY